MTLHVFTVLTVGGHRLWKEEDHLLLREDILEPNGFTPRSCVPYKDVRFCELDPCQINWSDYYDWKEVEDSSDVFCWRSFYLLGSPSSSSSSSSSSSPLSPPSLSWLSLPTTEGLDPYSYNELFTSLISAIGKNTS